MTIPGTDFESNESISDAVYNLMGININPNNLVDLIIVSDYIKTNQSINGKLKFVYKELQREYYSYYLNDSKIYPYEITEFGKLTRVPLEKLLTSKDYLEYLPAYNELNKRLNYQKY